MRKASEPVTRVQSYDENPEECPYLLIQPDPSCAECAAIMVWRSAHPWIAIANGAEIRLSDAPWGGRHQHMRDVRVAHHKDRVARRPVVKESPVRVLGTLSDQGRASVAEEVASVIELRMPSHVFLELLEEPSHPRVPGTASISQVRLDGADTGFDRGFLFQGSVRSRAGHLSVVTERQVECAAASGRLER